MPNLSDDIIERKPLTADGLYEIVRNTGSVQETIAFNLHKVELSYGLGILAARQSQCVWDDQKFRITFRPTKPGGFKVSRGIAPDPNCEIFP